MTTFCFPTETHGMPVHSLNLSVRASNALRRNNFHTLGDLNGVSTGHLAALKYVGSMTVDEISTASTRFNERANAFEKWEFANADDPAPAGEVRSGWVIPQEISESPISALGLPTKSLAALQDRGILTLGDLAGYSVGSAQTELSLSAGAAHRVSSAVEALISIDPLWLQQASRDFDGSTYTVPGCGPDVLTLLSKAEGASEELEALLEGQVDRDRHFALARWCYFASEQPTLDSLADEAGITRERVRQIVERTEEKLRESGLLLPRISQLVAVLREAGGVLSTRQYEERVTSRGLKDASSIIRTLPFLAHLKLIPRVVFDPDWNLWVTGPGENLLTSGKLPHVLQRVSRYLNRQLRRSSCVDADALTVKLPFGAEHALRLAAGRSARVEWVGSYGIPVPLTRSKLTNAALKLLSVSRTVSLEQAYSGLRRALGSVVPPPEVLAAVLAHHPQIRVEQHVVSAHDSLDPDKVLSPAERIAIALFAAGGDVLLAGNFIDAMVSAGFSVPMASIVLRRPYVRPIGAGIYGLRGRSIHRDTVRARIQERSRERERNVVASEQMGDALVVRYRITRFSRNGVLAQPKQLRDVSGVWNSYFPDGSDAALKIDNGFIWTIQPWLKQIKAKEGDFIIGTFDRSTQRVIWAYERAHS